MVYELVSKVQLIIEKAKMNKLYFWDLNVDYEADFNTYGILYFFL